MDFKILLISFFLIISSIIIVVLDFKGKLGNIIKNPVQFSLSNIICGIILFFVEIFTIF